MNLKTVQHALKGMGIYKGQVDNLTGPLTRAAVEAALEKFVPRVNWRNWSGSRKIIGVMQALFRAVDIETGIVDGYVGTQTLYAFDVWEHLQLTGKKPELWRDDVTEAHVADAPAISNVFPRQRSLTRHYGQVGGNQASLKLPFEMKIAWNMKQRVRAFSIHEKCHDSAKRVFDRIAGHYSPEQLALHGFDLFGGCLNVRKMRGGSSWSTHAWGIAIDFDPIRNQLRWDRDRAYLDDPACAQFWNFWADEGWLSLGRAKNFDWMHVQAARL